MNKTSLGLLLLLSLAAACKDPNADKPKPPPDAAPQVVAPPRSAPTEERMAFEAKHRAKVKITAEQALAAIDGAGLATVEPKQVIAGDIGASYCVNAHIANTAYIVVACEYESPEAAARGREVALERYKVPNQEILVNESTTLKVVNQSGTMPSADEGGKKIIEAFKNLK